ncbi:hypothetical protein HFN_1002 [Helicobacter fennelliae MRY12-0050]|uniref:Uncharacterized protein n=1 Tax=Helicobacter fennelliae MRY12-0050 TaxID=1325130 RepID=T1DWV9_9HELI|nr:hypothetical protein HFN_1002 [Helicobacter fennelliae MRY12-0050]
MLSLVDFCVFNRFCLTKCIKISTTPKHLPKISEMYKYQNNVCVS